MKVLVLGATGFIGNRVVRSLVRHGHTVSALTRQQDKVEALQRLGARPRVGDLDNQDTLRDAIEETDAIVNVAFPNFLGRMTMRRARRDAQEGLRQMQNLLEAVARVGAVPMVLTEGTMAYGDSGTGWVDQDSPYTFDRGHGRLLRLSVPYARSVAAAMNVPTVTLSIAGVYGAGSWFKESLYKYIKRGWGMVVGDGQNVWSFVHVDDVAEAYRLAVEKLPIGQTFTIADDEPVTYMEFANAVAGHLGKPKVRRMPRLVASLMMGTVLCEALTMNQRVKNTKAKRELGWQPRFPTYREGIPVTLQAIEELRVAERLQQRLAS